MPELAQVIVVEWNRRFTRRLGDAAYSPINYGARIRLSIPLWPRASEADRRETVIHEACHIIAVYKFGGYVVVPHGPEWKEAMKNCGVEPLRTHAVDRSGLARRQRLFILLHCPREGMEKKCRMNAKEHNVLRRGGEFWCRKCGLHLNQNTSIEEDRTTVA